jgi:hypothetical protein
MDETIEEHVVEEIKEQEIEDPNKNAKNDSPTQVISETKESEVNSKESDAPRQLESDPVTAILEQNKLEAELAFPSLSNEGESSSFGSSSKLSFSDVDYAADSENNVQVVDAPKNFERLDEISAMRNAQRKMEEDEDENENVRLQIFDQDVTLDSLDVHNIEFPELRLEPDLLLDDVEVLA